MLPSSCISEWSGYSYTWAGSIMEWTYEEQVFKNQFSVIAKFIQQLLSSQAGLGAFCSTRVAPLLTSWCVHHAPMCTLQLFGMLSFWNSPSHPPPYVDWSNNLPVPLSTSLLRAGVCHCRISLWETARNSFKNGWSGMKLSQTRQIWEPFIIMKKDKDKVVAQTKEG